MQVKYALFFVFLLFNKMEWLFLVHLYRWLRLQLDATRWPPNVFGSRNMIFVLEESLRAVMVCKNRFCNFLNKI
jgi:hypothetical protein